MPCNPPRWRMKPICVCAWCGGSSAVHADALHAAGPVDYARKRSSGQPNLALEEAEVYALERPVDLPALDGILWNAEVGYALACPAVERSSPRAASRHDGDGKLKHTPPIEILQALCLARISPEKGQPDRDAVLRRHDSG